MNSRTNPPQPLDEQALIAQIKAGDRAAFSRLVESHVDSVSALAQRLLGSSSDVPGVVQDVFLQVLKKVHQFRGAASFETWLTRIVINRCRSHHRWRLLLRNTYRKCAEQNRASRFPPDGTGGTVHAELKFGPPVKPDRFLVNMAGRVPIQRDVLRSWPAVFGDFADCVRSACHGSRCVARCSPATARDC